MEAVFTPTSAHFYLPLFVNFCDKTLKSMNFVAKNPLCGQKFLKKWPQLLT
jgi:hypothetical protein